MKVSFDWTKTVTQRYSATIKIPAGTSLDDWDLEMLAQEIDDDCLDDDVELIGSTMYDTSTDYDADRDSIDILSDDPPVMPSALCTKT